MSELRKDPIVGRWVIVAPNRAERPQDIVSQPVLQTGLPCPFCEGNEEQTPPEVAACREAGSQRDGPGWRVRVVPNKFPALRPEAVLETRVDGLYETMAGVGRHEVIVESPRHLASVSELSAEQLGEVLEVYRDRLVEARQDRRLVYGLIFKNFGAAAGASLAHLHSQLIATPTVPLHVREELAGAVEFLRREGKCVFCRIVEQELADRSRLVLESPRFVAFAPFASRFPYETWVTPKRHATRYEQTAAEDYRELAHVLRETLCRIERAVPRIAYNYFIHTSPFDTGPFDSGEPAHYHWHIEIIPRLTNVAGFEWGAGYFINPLPPEEAAAILREAEERSPETPKNPTAGSG